MRVLEHFGLVCWEKRGQRALGGALSSLVFARSAGRVSGTLKGHVWRKQGLEPKWQTREGKTQKAIGAAFEKKKKSGDELNKNEEEEEEEEEGEGGDCWKQYGRHFFGSEKV